MTHRIGYVLKKYPRLSETFILNEILGVEAAGLEVSIASLTAADEGSFHGDLARVKARAEYIPAVSSSTTAGAFAFLAQEDSTARDALPALQRFSELLPEGKRGRYLIQAILLAKKVRDEGLQHLHAHFMTIAARIAYGAHLLTGVTFSVTAHAKDIFRHDVDEDVFREVAAAAKCLVTVSDHNETYIADRYFNGDSSCIRRIYNGMPLNDLPSATVEREPDLILAVGRLVEKKGFDLLLRAARELCDRGRSIRLAILGDGDERKALEDLAIELELGGVVEFHGAVDRDHVWQMMRRARCLAAPCRTGADGNKDALPTVLIEALGLGLPIVSTDVGGIVEIVDDGVDGFVHKEEDLDALVGRLEQLVVDDQLWARLSEAGPGKALAKFDRTKTLPQLLEVFQSKEKHADLHP